MKRLTSALLTVGALSVMAMPALGQTTANASSSITIGTVLYISAANPTVAFAGPAGTDFDAGYIASTTTTTITHRSNVRHSVSVAASSATMTPSGGAAGADAARATKPASDLRWSSDGTTYNGLTTSAAAVRSAVARGTYSDLNVQYRMGLSYADDTPGTYGLNFTYTIAPD